METIDEIVNHFGHRVKVLVSDNGREFRNTKMAAFCRSRSVTQRFTTPYYSEQNPTTERWNRTLQAGFRTLLSDSGLSFKFWTFATRAFSYLHNRAYVIPGIHKTPYEIWTKRKVLIDHLWGFGSIGYAVDRRRRAKSENRNRLAQLLGYTATGYIVIFIGDSSIKEVRTGRFPFSSSSAEFISESNGPENSDTFQFADLGGEAEDTGRNSNDIGDDLDTATNSNDSSEIDDIATDSNAIITDINDTHSGYFDTHAAADLDERNIINEPRRAARVVLVAEILPPRSFAELQHRSDGEDGSRHIMMKSRDLKALVTAW